MSLTRYGVIEGRMFKRVEICIFQKFFHLVALNDGRQLVGDGDIVDVAN